MNQNQNYWGDLMEIEKIRSFLVTKLTHFFEQDDSTLGIFLGGSLANGNADQFSDIDFRVVVSNEVNKKQLLLNISAFPEILFVETIAEDHGVFHFVPTYDSGKVMQEGIFGVVKVDVFFYYKREITTSLWFKNILILKDDGFLEKIKNNSQFLTYQPSQEELDFLLSKFYANIHEQYRRYYRNELNYVVICANYIKNIICALWLMEMGKQPNGIGDWSKYEGKRSKLLNEQKNWLKEHTQIDNLKQFQDDLIQETLRTVNQIAHKFNLNFDNKKFDEVTEKIDAKTIDTCP